MSCLADFLGSLITRTIAPPEGFAYCHVRLGMRICLHPSTPTRFNAQFRLGAAVSLLRPRVAIPASDGILTVSSIGFAVRLILRARLTPGRLTLPGKPWPFGERASHPLYRYLYLHLLFHTLQRGSSPAFNASGMLPYQQFTLFRGFGGRFYTRLLSTRGPSTSELLRTL